MRWEKTEAGIKITSKSYDGKYPYTVLPGWRGEVWDRDNKSSSLQVSVRERGDMHADSVRCRGLRNACTYHMETPFFVECWSGNVFLPQDVCNWMLRSSRPLETLPFCSWHVSKVSCNSAAFQSNILIQNGSRKCIAKDRLVSPKMQPSFLVPLGVFRQVPSQRWMLLFICSFIGYSQSCFFK